ncbi:MAG: FAD-binding protein [Victivallales bacterium]|jgi:glycolate oxidase|nr:FAD-binding protein [Victivallales bacterium]
MPEYNQLTDSIAQELIGIFGAANVYYNDAERLEPYAHDEAAGCTTRVPEAVVRPKSAEEISQLMKLANREKIPVTARGAGSGLSGGAVPIHGGIVIDCCRMNHILDVDKGNMTVTVEPGVITSEINEMLRPHGLFYAGYPMSLETCTIGGNVAENAGGGKAVKYGVTGRYVIGLEVVSPTGDIVQLGGKLVKDVSGINLLQLMIGSEGILGIFTKIILKLLPLPKASVDMLCLFNSIGEAIGAVPKIMTEGGVIPTAVEFMDKLSFQTACQYLNETLPCQDSGAMLLITIDGADAAQVEHDYDVIGEQCLKAGATQVYVADTKANSERIWRIRRSVAEAFKVFSPNQSLEDIVVPIASIPDMSAAIDRISKKYGVLIPCYGHAGDGNLHATPVMPPEWSLDKWQEVLPNLLMELYAETIALGGHISGEHGIGHKRKKYMLKLADKGFLTMMQAVKNGLDPNGILNPGKIF